MPFRERSTPNKTTISAIIRGADKPISGPEILKKLHSRGLMVNKSTVYRELDRLKEKQEVNSVSFADGVERFEPNEHHHHHVVCTQCDTVKHVENEEQIRGMEKELERQTGFTLQKHVVEFFGLCNSCQHTTAQ